MPTLLDALSALDSQSDLICQLAAENTRPAGPFTVAQLHGNTNVLDIIRDAEEHERRLFRFIGEQADGKGKMVEKRSKGMVTPLRNGLGAHLPGGAAAAAGAGTTMGGKGKGKVGAEDEAGGSSDGWNDPQVLLRTALKLVDEYRPMPRARAHILALLDQYAENQRAIAALEESIEEASMSNSKRPKAVSDSLLDEPEPDFDDEDDTAGGQAEQLSPADWLKREEEAVKRLEAEVAELRKQVRMARSRSVAASRDADTRAQQKRAQAASGRSPIAPSPGFTPSPRSAVPPKYGGSRLANSPARSRGDGDSASTPRSPKFTLRPAPRTSSMPSPSPSPLASTFGARTAVRESSSPLSASQASREKAAVFGVGTKGRTGGLARSVSGPNRGESDVSPAGPSSPQTTAMVNLVVHSPHTELAVSSPASSKSPRSPRSPARRLQPISPATTAAASARSPLSANGSRTPESPSAAQKQDVTTSQPSTPQAKESTAEENTATPRARTAVTPAGARKRKQVEGVEIRSDVRAAISKIWATLGEALRSGEGSPSPDETFGTAETIKHIAHLAESPLPPPLSPSTASTSSTLPPAGAPVPPSAYRPPPLTPQSILICAFLLNLLRAPGMVLPMIEMKEALGEVTTARGWDMDVGTRVIYNVVARKTVKIDRKGGGAGKISFAI